MMQAAGASNDHSRTDRPRFRQDLFAEVVEEHGAKFIDVMDPDSGNLFRFYEVEYSLACGMDGERDVPGIVKWAQDELGLSPSANEVRAVIATLGDLGFIDARAAAEAAAAAEDLAPGIVAGKPAAVAAPEVALGAPGPSPLVPPPAPARPVEPVALGASGPGQARKPSEPVEDIALGAPGAARTTRPTPAPALSAGKPAGVSEVSIDLADHIEVGRDDVKEAVRQSKIMTAVEVPPELAAALEAPRQPERPASRPPEPVVTRPEPVVAREPIKAPEPARVEVRPEPVVAKAPEPVAAKAPEPVRVEVRPEPVVARAPEPVVAKEPVRPEPVGKPPVELPKQPIVADKTPVAPPAPASRVSPVLVVLLILIVLGAAAFAVWKFVLQSGSSVSTDKPPATSEATPPPVKPAAPTPTPPPPAPPPTTKIALVEPEAEEIKAGHAGVIETIIAEKAVKAEEVVVRITGDRPIEAQLSALGKEEKKLSDQVDAAAKANAADLGDKKKALDAKREQIAAKKTELAGYALQASHDGKFTPAVKNGLKITEDDVLGKLQRDAQPTATFAIDTAPFASETTVSLSAAGAAPVTCTIEDKKPNALKVACPADAGLTDGADVTLQLPGAAPAAGSAAPAAGSAAPAAAGSDSAAAPAAGSSEAPAGSAAGSATK